jgi:hypothetical protein
LLSACGAGLTNDPGSGETPFTLSLIGTIPDEFIAGECSEYEFTVRVVEREDGRSVYMDRDLEITLSTQDGDTELTEKGFLQSNAECSGSETTLTIPQGGAETSFRLQLTSSDVSGFKLATDDSRVGGFESDATVIPNIPGALELSNLPATAGINTTFTSSPSVRILDSWGNFVSDSASNLEAEVFDNSSCTQAASGALQNFTSTAIDGIGTFTSLRYTTAGTIYLRVQIPATQILSNCAGPIVVQ